MRRGKEEVYSNQKLIMDKNNNDLYQRRKEKFYFNKLIMDKNHDDITNVSQFEKIDVSKVQTGLPCNLLNQSNQDSSESCLHSPSCNLPLIHFLTTQAFAKLLYSVSTLVGASDQHLTLLILQVRSQPNLGWLMLHSTNCVHTPGQPMPGAFSHIFFCGNNLLYLKPFQLDAYPDLTLTGTNPAIFLTGTNPAMLRCPKSCSSSCLCNTKHAHGRLPKLQPTTT